MPRDPRPYVTYPLGYTSHPRWELLSDAAFRAMHEMQDVMRQQGLDGRMLIAQAERRWRKRVLAELVAGIDDRPLLVREGDHYVVRSYAEHQFTTADAEALRKKRAEAGRAGGLASGSSRRSKAEALASDNGKQNEPESESKSESKSGQTDITHHPENVTKVDARAGDDDTIIVEWFAGMGFPSHRLRVLAAIRGVLGPIPAAECVDVAAGIAELSVEHIRHLASYVETACLQSPGEVRDIWSRIPKPPKAVSA